MRKVIILAGIVLPIVALLYFGLTRDPSELPSALLGKPAPDFTLQTLQGETMTLSSLKGNPVIINFWSTWCGTCLEEHQLIRQAYQILQSRGFFLFSILYEDTPENAKEFIARYGQGAPVLTDPQLKTAINYGVVGVPETFFIDREGLVRYKHSGMLNSAVLLKQIGVIKK